MSAKLILSKDILDVTPKGEHPSILLDYKKLRKAVLTFRAANHPMRKKIICLIEEKEKITVSEIYNLLKMEQAIASQHLAILRKAEIVNTSRNNKFIFYSINKKRIGEITAFVNELTQKK